MDNPNNPNNPSSQSSQSSQNNPSNESDKKQIATEMVSAVLERLDNSVEAQVKIAEALHRLADMGEGALDIALRYDEIIQELIERYSKKASLGASKIVIPILQEVSQIISHFKEIGNRVSEE